MKHFIFKTEYKKSSYGSNVINTVYQIKKGVPMYIGETRYNTGSFRGHDHEALQLIVDLKLLPKTSMDRPNRGYINWDKLNKTFTLHSI